MNVSWGIRSRVILVAMLPMLVLAVVLTAFYTSSRIADIEEAYTARSTAFARQLVAASEYAVFSGNNDALQQLAMAMLAEDGVVGVMVMDRFGEILARSGKPASGIGFDKGLVTTSLSVSAINTLRIIEPILPSRVELDDGLGAGVFESQPAWQMPPVLGKVVIDLSRTHIDSKRAELLRTGVLTVLVVLIGALALAVSMSRGVSGPIRRVAAAVEKIGRGQFSERVPIVGGGSLKSLAEGVNEMAAELSSMHDEMSRRIDEATHELRARKEEAERANMAKSRFLAAASHDLRQPMHALGLFIAELSQLKQNANRERLIEQISASAEAMEDLLDSLLDISKLDAGVLEPCIRSFALQPLFERIAGAQQSYARDRGLELRIRPTDQWASSDPVLIERILGNLLSNAIRYTPAGRILLACRKRGDRLRIEVRDSGIGIPAEARTIIFQEFVQLDNPERARDKGLGLGLAIVRRLIDLLDHRLEVISEPGRGSVFAIELAASAPVTDSPESTPKRSPGDLAGIRIALVDDDPLALSATHGLLLSWGCEVVAAHDATTLLDELAADGRPPQVVICDFRLAGSANGIELIRAIRARWGSGLPAALITGDTGPDVLGLAHEAELPLLHKPVRPARLRALLNRLITNCD